MDRLPARRWASHPPADAPHRRRGAGGFGSMSSGSTLGWTPVSKLGVKRSVSGIDSVSSRSGSATSHHLDQRQHAEPTRRHRQDEHTQQCEPSAPRQQDDQQPDGAGEPTTKAMAMSGRMRACSTVSAAAAPNTPAAMPTSIALASTQLRGSGITQSKILPRGR